MEPASFSDLGQIMPFISSCKVNRNSRGGELIPNILLFFVLVIFFFVILIA